MSVFIKSDSDIIHETSVDFVLRPVSKEIHVVQYDNLLPVVKVYLYNNGERYILPNEAIVNLRFGKVDHTFVYTECERDPDRDDVVYFRITTDMTVLVSKVNVVLEVVSTENFGSSSPITIVIDKNPIQNGDIESHVSMPIIEQMQEQIAQNTADIEDIKEHGSGGDVNVIESISVNNIPLPVDKNKNVNIDGLDYNEVESILVYGSN